MPIPYIYLLYGTGKRNAFIFCGLNSSNIYQLPAARYIIYPDNFKVGIAIMLFVVYYIIAFIVLVLHYTGRLERWGMQWLVLVLAITVFPAVIYL